MFGRVSETNFIIMLIMIFILFVIHEWGHYLAFKMFGISSHFRKSIIAPGVDPNETVIVSRFQGIVIALSGFFVSTILFVLPMTLIYPLWKVLLIGTFAGASLDFLWAFSMVFSKEITINSSYREKR